MRPVTSQLGATTTGRTSPTAGPSGHAPASTPVVVLVSGSGTLLQALIDASADPDYGVSIVAVGADRQCEGIARAQRSGIPTFVCRTAEFATRAEWDVALTAHVREHRPALVVSAGFRKLVGPTFLTEFGGRYLNSHNALLPSFPGIHAPRDALEYGVKISGATLFVVDDGVDTGAVVAQVAVPVLEDDTLDSLTERIKESERPQLVDYVGRMARDGFTISNRKVTIP